MIGMASKKNESQLKNLSDTDLLAMVRDDSMEAFEELYYRYWKKLYSFAFKRIRSKEVNVNTAGQSMVRVLEVVVLHVRE